MTPARVSFPGGLGADLAGRLDVPAATPRATALFAHCFTCSKDVLAASRISAGLVAAGFAVLRFDFTGLGGSGGDFESTGFASNVEDLIVAAEWLAEHHDAPRLLVGHSFGGAAVIAAAPFIGSVDAVATIGAPADLRHLEALFVDSLDEIDRDGVASVNIASRSFTIRRSFVDELRSTDHGAAIAGLDTPLLVLHAPEDEIVGVEHGERLFAAARQPKSFVALSGADHLLSDSVHAASAADAITTWASRIIGDPPGVLDAPRSSAQVVVAETGDVRFLNAVVAGSHRFLADEPVDAGGLDAGPGPYDLLAASLGACTSMTLRMYADRKRIPLERVVVEVDHAKVHSADCSTCDEKHPKLIDQLDRVIHVSGDLTDEQRASLLAIADRCPVHRTLESSTQITTALAPALPTGDHSGTSPGR